MAESSSADSDVIDDDESVLRRVPPGTLWQAPGPRLSSKNFELRHDRGELGVSVSRERLTSPDQLLLQIPDDVLSKMGARSEWRVARALVGDIRRLGFRVIPDPLPDDPGHALILSDRTSLDDRTGRKRLSRLFAFIETGQ